MSVLKFHADRSNVKVISMCIFFSLFLDRTAAVPFQTGIPFFFFLKF